MKKLLLIVTFAGLTACAQLGIAPADTTAKKIAAGYETVASLSDSAFNLRAQGLLSADEKNTIAAKLKQAEAAIDEAALLTKTDPKAADSRLTVVIAALTQLQAYLAAHSKK